MSRRTNTIEAAYFDALYKADQNQDPWGFRSSAYEAAKYDDTLRALVRPRYASALEVGCAIGVFTARLAPRCDRLLAIDGSAVALETARQAGAGLPGLSFALQTVPDGFPAGRFDLITLSEVLYYLTEADLDRTAACCLAAQGQAGDEVVLCHWLGETDYPLSGAAASDRFTGLLAAAGYRHDVLHDETYRLERLVRS